MQMEGSLKEEWEGKRGRGKWRWEEEGLKAFIES